MALGSAAGRGAAAARARKSRRAITGSVWHIGGCAWLIYRRPFPFYDSSRSGWLLSSSTLCQVVEHDVDHHAGDRDVEPDGERPAGDLAVLVVAGAQAAAQGDHREIARWTL